jgi:hypothetical protein
MPSGGMDMSGMSAGSMNMGGMDMTGSGSVDSTRQPAAGDGSMAMDINDIDYDAYLTNDRTAAAPL